MVARLRLFPQKHQRRGVHIYSHSRTTNRVAADEASQGEDIMKRIQIWVQVGNDEEGTAFWASDDHVTARVSYNETLLIDDILGYMVEAWMKAGGAGPEVEKWRIYPNHGRRGWTASHD